MDAMLQAQRVTLVTRVAGYSSMPCRTRARPCKVRSPTHADPRKGAMPDLDDARRIALALPETTSDGGSQVKVAGKAFIWSWLERIDPGKGRVPNPDVLVVSVASEDVKYGLVDAEPDRFFTEPHYDGYRAVMVRLPMVSEAELEDLITDAWRARAPRKLVERSGAAG
jgi:hypothetical protein